MARRSARIGGSQPSSSPASASSPKGTKRKAGDASSPSNKKTKKQQKTLEETMPEVENDPKDADVEMEDSGAAKGGAESVKLANGDASKDGEKFEDKSDEKMDDAKPDAEDETIEEKSNAKDETVKPAEKELTKPDDESKEALAANTGEEPTKHESKDDATKSTEETNGGNAEASKDDDAKDDVSKSGKSNGKVDEPEEDGNAKGSSEKLSSDAKDEPAKASDDAEDGGEKSASNVKDGTAKSSRDAKDGAAKSSSDAKEEPAKSNDNAKKEAEKATNDAKDEPTKSSSNTKDASNGDLVKEKHARDDKVASNIIEKGIIYFFTRGRVNVEEPEGVQDLQRSFFVLRPIPTGAKLGDGPIDDSKTNRLFAVPKKVFPESGKDRFMAFVEKAKVSMSELKEDFFRGDDYETKAGDTRHTPSVMPVGEGVYAITEVGRGSHLAYVLTIPNEPGELQDEMGIHSKGSFALSLKNPKNKGPANTQLPQSPDFPQSIMDDFRGLAWMPVHKSEYLDYANAQILLIGEGADRFGGGAVDKAEGEKGESPEKELERLEEEDAKRVEKLDGEDAVFKDLHLRKGEYSEVKTTW